MVSPDTAPEELPERELFTEYVELLEQDSAANGYQQTKLDERRASLLAEIGERLEALEAAKALLSDENVESNHDSTDTEQANDSMELSFDEE